MKTELLNAGELSMLGECQYDEIIIGRGFVQCFRDKRCYATYALDCFDEESVQSFTIKDQE